ncbi:MAG: VOC family protein [Candidatus Dormibacteraceae bacterium]
MIRRIHHVGLAVADLEGAIALYGGGFGAQMVRRGHSDAEAMDFALMRIGASELELMHSADQGSAVSRFLARRGPGVHHLAYQVSDLPGAVEEMADRGHRLVGGIRAGVHGNRVAFLHPSSMGGVLTELVEEI